MDFDFQLILIFNSTLFSKLGRYLAYLDPGSGSYFIQLLLASLMGALFILGSAARKAPISSAICSQLVKTMMSLVKRKGQISSFCDVPVYQYLDIRYYRILELPILNI